MGEHTSGTPWADARDTLYYDGLCPLCTREIDALRRERGDGLALVDVHELPESESTELPSRSELLRVLHLRRADGSWLSAADANVAAWEGTAQGRWLKLLRWPMLRWPVDLCYALWASWRFRRRYGSARDSSPDSAS